MHVSKACEFYGDMGTILPMYEYEASIDGYDVGFGRKLRSCRASVELVGGSMGLVLDSI